MLKPNMLRTNKDLRTYDPLGRQCYYETERYLRFFRVYTQRNCEMECITNYTVSKCGCSAFYLPSGYQLGGRPSVSFSLCVPSWVSGPASP